MGQSSFIARFFYLVGVSSSCSVPNTDKDFLEQWVRIKVAIALGYVLQFVVLPLVGWSIVKVLDLDVVTATSVLFATTSPGHVFALLWCSLFNADLLLSMFMTGLSNLGIAFLPALVWFFHWTGMYRSLWIWTCLFVPLIFVFLGFYLRDASMIYMVPIVSRIDEQLSGKAMMNTLWIGVGAIGSLITSVKSDKIPIHSKQLAYVIGILACLYFVDDYVAKYTAYFFPVPSFWARKEPWRGSIWAQEPVTYLCVFLVVVLRMFVTIAVVSVTNLTKPEKMAFVIQMCCQNAECAVASAVKTFHDTGSFLGVPVFYGFCQTVALAIYCLGCWKLGWTKAPADESLSRIIWTTYEVETNESSHSAWDVPFGDREVNGARED